MKLKIGICDDDASIHTLLTKFFTQYMIATDNEFDIHHYFSGEELLSDYSIEKSFHILILDIEMPGLSGIDAAKKIRSIPDNNVIIIFLSSFPEYMQNCFPVHACRFFVKPINYEYFSSQFSMVLEEIKKSGMQLVLTTSPQEDTIINLSDIIYIAADKHYSSSYPLAFHCIDNIYHCKGSIADYEEALKKNYFISPIRGYIINLKYLFKFSDHQIILRNGETVPLSPKKEKEIKSLFQKYVLDTRYISQ